MLKIAQFLSITLLLSGLTTNVFAQKWLDLKEQGANYYEIKQAFEKENAGKMKEFARELRNEANGKAAKAGKYEREMEGMVHFMRWNFYYHL